MSLRDQLLKAGLASKKDAAKVKRELKQKRKEAQGHKRKKKHVERERRAAEAKARAEEKERLIEEKRAREAARDRYEEALRVRNLVLGNRVKSSGKQPFWFKGRDGRTVHRLDVHRKVAEELAHGRLAIARLDHGNREEPVIIGRDAAERIAELDPSVLLHFAPGPHGGDPAEELFQRDWEPSIGPHRVRE